MFCGIATTNIMFGRLRVLYSETFGLNLLRQEGKVHQRLFVRHKNRSLAIDRLRWFDDFAVDKYWRSPDAVRQQLQGLTQTWYTAGPYDQLNMGCPMGVSHGLS